MAASSIKLLTDDELLREVEVAHAAVVDSRVETFIDFADRHRNRISVEMRRRGLRQNAPQTRAGA